MVRFSSRPQSFPDLKSRNALMIICKSGHELLRYWQQIPDLQRPYLALCCFKMVMLAYKLGTVAVLSAGAVYWSDALDNPWCSSLRIVRGSRAAWAALVVSADYKWSLYGLEPGTPSYTDIMRKVHVRSAERLRDVCSRNGGLFIKVGQHLGSMDYLLPQEYVNTFKVFHSDAPQTPLYRMKQVIREELGQSAEEVFAELGEEPLGAASLAQCHRGVLKNGRVVAVKIQHPDVLANAYSDMDTIDVLVASVKWLFPDFHLGWLAKEARTNLPLELDFCNEARNLEKFSKLFSHLKFVRAPQVFWELTTPRVLTMEFIEGGKIDNLSYIRENKIPPSDISQKLGKMYSEMIFLRGFVHCDPHPGNVLVRTGQDGGAEIVLLDHGLYSQLTDDFRLTYCRLWRAFITGDQAAIKQHCLELNAGELYRLLACMVTARAWEHVQAGITQQKQSQAELQRIRERLPMYVSEITQLLDTVPRQLILILRTNDVLRGIETVLGSPIHQHSYLSMSQCCLRAIGAHEARNSPTWVQWAVCVAQTRISLLCISLYKVWLWWKAALSGNIQS